MPFAAIEKDREGFKIAPHLFEYSRSCAEFSWQQVERELRGGGRGRGLNIADYTVDRHAEGPRALHLALRWLGNQGEALD